MEVKIVPITTRILTPKDDIVDVIEKYTKDQITENDVITVAESVVAITQNMIVRPDEMEISDLARFCCRFIPDYGSLATPHGMQALMNAEGKWRVAAALFIGFLGKLIGIRGLFYKFGGRQAALIDDCTGTMPPFDKCVVYGPDKPEQVVNNLKNRLLIDNPVGNASQKTPICIIKNFRQHQG